MSLDTHTLRAEGTDRGAVVPYQVASDDRFSRSVDADALDGTVRFEERVAHDLVALDAVAGPDYSHCYRIFHGGVAERARRDEPQAEVLDRQTVHVEKVDPVAWPVGRSKLDGGSSWH